MLRAGLKRLAVQVRGEFHPRLWPVQRSLGQVLIELDRGAEAEPLLRQVAAATARVRGPRHPETALAEADLARALEDLRRYADSERTLKHALQPLLQALGPACEPVSRLQRQLAHVYLDWGRFAEAAATFRADLQAVQSRLGPRHPEVAESQSLLANALMRQGRPADAAVLLRQALLIRDAQQPAAYELLLKGFPSKLRSQVRRAQKEGMTVRVGGSECLGEFYAVFSRCMRDLGTPVYAKEFFAKILEVFPKEARICIVSHGDVPVAAGFLYGFRSTMEIPWAASDKRFNRLAPNMLLYGTVLEYACQQGFQVFDFGRSSPDSGTYRFKEQWGAQPHQLYWYYWMGDGRQVPQLNPQNPKYALAIRVWQKLPLAVANLLGPHIVKHLP